MNKICFLFICAILAVSCTKSDLSPQPADSEFLRSSEFHEKYTLAEVVIFSRHNVRAPKSDPGSFISTVTPHTWHNFGVGNSELTEKGGILETIGGQFFRKWLNSEGLCYFGRGGQQRALFPALRVR